MSLLPDPDDVPAWVPWLIIVLAVLAYGLLSGWIGE